MSPRRTCGAPWSTVARWARSRWRRSACRVSSTSPAPPPEKVSGPPAPGPAFAARFTASPAATEDAPAPSLRRAMVYGGAMGSFAVEAFGVQGLEHVTRSDVRARVRAFKDLVHFY